MRSGLAVGLTAALMVGMACGVPAHAGRDGWREGGPLRERLAQRRLAGGRRAQGSALVLPPGAQLQRDLAYGPDPRQRLDVYRPARPDGRLVVMVHGGGWRQGDKAMANVVDHKAERWLPGGVTFVSVNYRMLPDADPALQARDVAAAVARVQQLASGWGADPARLVLMGHSAGGHLVALLAADPARWRDTGLRPWQATVVLDAGAIDVPALMSTPHEPLFDAAFGSDPAGWRAVSPLHQLSARATPMLLVCSTRRQDASCGPTRDFAQRATALGVRAPVRPEPLSHMRINDTLGEPGAYTEGVEAFLARIDPAWR